LVDDDFRTDVVDLLEELLETFDLEGVDLVALDLVALFVGGTTLGFGEDVLEPEADFTLALALLDRDDDVFFDALCGLDVFGLDVFDVEVLAFELVAPSDFFDSSVFSFFLPLSLLFLGVSA
jgi:hypothetical protein